MADTTTGTAQIRLLGLVEIGSDGDSIGGRTQQRLLAYFLLYRGSVVSVEALIDATWPGNPPDRAAHNIRTYVHRLRSVVDINSLVIETVTGGYRLNLINATVDTDEFEHHLAVSARLQSQAQHTAAIGECELALDLWLGPPFGDLGYEPWARAEVARLEELHQTARERHAELLMAVSRPGQAVIELRAIIEEHPSREGPQLLLLKALHSSGRTTEALRSFQDYRSYLIQEVGVEPSAAIVELDRAIARGEVVDLDASGISGGYELHERIGEGAFAVVHRATHRLLDREVAVKIIRAELANDTAFVRSFEAEARIVAGIDHPNVVPLYDFWRDPDQAFLVMPYLSGGSVADQLSGEGLATEEVLRIVDQVAEALTAAHLAGVVHRDVKPANVLFAPDGRALLGDFGMATKTGLIDSQAGNSPVSSLQYSAPELLEEGAHVDVRSDVYGLAALAYSMFTGELPFEQSVSADGLRSSKASGPIDMLGSRRPDLERAAEVVSRATSPDALERHRSAHEFASDLRSAALGPTATSLGLRTATNPYRGLRPFDESSSALFHGRNRLVSELLERLHRFSSLAVVGASGSGKSSVVRAGLIPALRRGEVQGSDSWFPVLMTPGAHPFEALETALLRIAVNPPDSLLAQLRDGERGVLRAVQRVLPSDDAVLLLVVDQLEELYTNVNDPAEVDAFQRAMATAVSEPDTPLRLVLTLRADFHDRPLRHQSFAPVLKQATVAVTPLTPDELEQVIVKPAHLVGATFGQGVVAAISADATDQPGALPLLQYALTRAFDHSDGVEISLRDYRAVGGISGSLTQQAEELYRKLDPDEQSRLRRIMGRLVALGEGTEDTRRVATRAELGIDDTTRCAIDLFGSARLFTFDHHPASREPTVEVAHEALIRNWPRLRTWLDEDREDLRTQRHLAQSAVEWESLGRADSELYRGGRLETAEKWFRDHTGEAKETEQAFLDASVNLRDAEVEAERRRFEEKARSNRRLRRSLSGVAILLACALAAGVLALQQRGSARAAAFDAETGRLVATAQELADSNPRAAMLLAVAANQRERSPATLGALQTALSQARPVLGHLGWGTEYIDAEWMVNGKIVGVREDGLDLFDPATGRLLDTTDAGIGVGAFPPFTASSLVSSASAESTLVVASGADISVLNVGDTFEPFASFAMPNEVAAVALSPNAETVVAIDASSLVWFSDNSGTSIVEVDVDDSANLYQQGVPILGEDFAFNEMVRPLPLLGALHPGEDGVIVQAGSFLHGFDWRGERSEDPLFVAMDLGELGLAVAPPRAVLADGLKPRLLVAGSSVWTREFAATTTTDPPELLVARVVPDLLGGGREPAVDLLAESGSTVTVMTADGNIVRVDLTDRTTETLVDESLGSSSGASVNPREGTQVAVSSQVGIAILSIVEAGPIASSVPRPSTAGNTTISFGGRYAVTGAAGSEAPTTVWRLTDSGWAREDSIPREMTVFAGVFPGEEEYLYVGGAIGEAADLVHVYDISGEEPSLYSSYVPGEGTTNSDISPDRRWDASVAWDVRLIEPETGHVLRRLPPPQGTRARESLTGVRFHPSSRSLLISNPSGNSDLWDTSTWELIEDETLQSANIAIGFWNADGTLFASASSDGRVSIRDGETFEIIRNMTGAVGTSNSWNGGGLLFSDDSSVLLTNFDNIGRLWDVQSGEQIGQPVTTFRGTNTGSNYGSTLQLITATEEHALIWNLNTDDWAGIACRTAGSNLTEDEWTQWGPRDEDFRTVCPAHPMQGSR